MAHGVHRVSAVTCMCRGFDPVLTSTKLLSTSCKADLPDYTSSSSTSRSTLESVDWTTLPHMHRHLGPGRPGHWYMVHAGVMVHRWWMIDGRSTRLSAGLCVTQIRRTAKSMQCADCVTKVESQSKEAVVCVCSVGWGGGGGEGTRGGINFVQPNLGLTRTWPQTSHTNSSDSSRYRHTLP